MVVVVSPEDFLRAVLFGQQLARRAGHSNIQITMGIYRHVLEAENRDAARRMEARLVASDQTDGQKDGQMAKNGNGAHAETLAGLSVETSLEQKSLVQKEPMG